MDHSLFHGRVLKEIIWRISFKISDVLLYTSIEMRKQLADAGLALKTNSERFDWKKNFTNTFEYLSHNRMK